MTEFWRKLLPLTLTSNGGCGASSFWGETAFIIGVCVDTTARLAGCDSMPFLSFTCMLIAPAWLNRAFGKLACSVVAVIAVVVATTEPLYTTTAPGENSCPWTTRSSFFLPCCTVSGTILIMVGGGAVATTSRLTG